MHDFGDNNCNKENLEFVSLAANIITMGINFKMKSVEMIICLSLVIFANTTQSYTKRYENLG